jgi:hypothetical protein
MGPNISVELGGAGGLGPALHLQFGAFQESHADQENDELVDRHHHEGFVDDATRRSKEIAWDPTSEWSWEGQEGWGLLYTYNLGLSNRVGPRTHFWVPLGCLHEPSDPRGQGVFNPPGRWLDFPPVVIPTSAVPALASASGSASILVSVPASGTASGAVASDTSSAAVDDGPLFLPVDFLDVSEDDDSYRRILYRER